MGYEAVALCAHDNRHTTGRRNVCGRPVHPPRVHCGLWVLRAACRFCPGIASAGWAHPAVLEAGCFARAWLRGPRTRTSQRSPFCRPDWRRAGDRPAGYVARDWAGWFHGRHDLQRQYLCESLFGGSGIVISALGVEPSEPARRW